MERINTAMQNFIEWKGVTNPIDMYIIVGLLFLIFMVFIKFIIEFYQDSVGPDNFDTYFKFVNCPKGGIQIKILVYNYGFMKVYHTYNLGKIYNDETEAMKDFMSNDDWIESTDDVMANRIFRLRLLHQIEAGQI